MNRIYYLLMAFVVFTISSACHKNTDNTHNQGKDIELTATEKQKTMADNQFTFNLFKNIAQGSGNSQNTFMSPLSVSFAFGMLANGASGQTQTEIYKTMNFTGFTEDAINTYYNKLISGLPGVDPDASIKIANSIWYDQKFSVLNSFLQTNTNYYQAAVQSLDFKNPSSTQPINNWVSANTNGKIPTIVNSIPNGVVMLLINAIYFKDQWDQRFDAAKTHQQAFYLPDNTTTQSTFMQGDLNVNTVYDDQASVLEVPYQGNKFSMVTIQPRQGTSLTQLLAALDTTRWNKWMAHLQSTRTTVIMPKFKFSYENGLNDVLKNMGMQVAFTDMADLSRIDGRRDLLISDVKHKAYIEVTEDGTEAAAVTSISVSLTSANQNTFQLDHPFIFMIREAKTGLILFTGIMNNPNNSGAQ